VLGGGESIGHLWCFWRHDSTVVFFLFLCFSVYPSASLVSIVFMIRIAAFTYMHYLNLISCGRSA
jgi:hypothetical protein